MAMKGKHNAPMEDGVMEANKALNVLAGVAAKAATQAAVRWCEQNNKTHLAPNDILLKNIRDQVGKVIEGAFETAKKTVESGKKRVAMEQFKSEMAMAGVRAAKATVAAK